MKSFISAEAQERLTRENSDASGHLDAFDCRAPRTQEHLLSLRTQLTNTVFTGLIQEDVASMIRANTTNEETTS